MENESCDYNREDDFFECFIYPVTNNADYGDDIIDKLYQDVSDCIESMCKEYIWHRDAFKIYKKIRSLQELSYETDKDFLSHIYGVCHFGDNIDDEWFIVYLLKEVTRKFPSLAVRVVDADGELLLIEAANSLPSWANPNNCSNRVFLHKGDVILIQPEDYDDITKLSPIQAVQRLYTNRDLHVANGSIHEDIDGQINEYPDKVHKNLHRTTVFTPVGVAALLKEDPSMISAAVHAFCNRDPIDTKVCRAMRYFPPENRVNTSITFTKSLYAMLVHNNFTPDRRTGWNLPPANSPQSKSHTLGAKLACGFEILVSQAGDLNSDITNNRAWKDYLRSLKKRNYFQDFLEDSKAYKELLNKAENYFRNNMDFITIGPQLGRKILDLLKELDVNEEVFRDNEASLPNDDDDSWLSIDPKELENMMQERYGKKNFMPLNNSTEASEFSKKISEFLDCQSGIDGVEVSNDNNDPMYSDIPVRPKRGIKKKKKQAVNSVNRVNDEEMKDSPSKTKIDFDADQFSSAIQNILDLVIPDDSWDFDSDSDNNVCGSGDEIETNIHKLATSESKEEDLMKKYMDQMDTELASTDIAKSFEVMDPTTGKVNIEQNALKNIKQSLEEEMGGSGPAGNMLTSLGYTKYTLFTSIDEEVD